MRRIFVSLAVLFLLATSPASAIEGNYTTINAVICRDYFAVKEAQEAVHIGDGKWLAKTGCSMPGPFFTIDLIDKSGDVWYGRIHMPDSNNYNIYIPKDGVSSELAEQQNREREQRAAKAAKANEASYTAMVALDAANKATLAKVDREAKANAVAGKAIDAANAKFNANEAAKANRAHRTITIFDEMYKLDPTAAGIALALTREAARKAAALPH